MAKNVSRELPEELRAYIDEAVASGKYASPDDVLRKALELLRGEEKPAAAREQRKGGQWKGMVTIAPDFDDLPDDHKQSFGAQ